MSGAHVEVRGHPREAVLYYVSSRIELASSDLTASPLLTETPHRPKELHIVVSHIGGAPATALLSSEMAPTGCGGRFVLTAAWPLLLKLSGSLSDTLVAELSLPSV